MNQRCILDIGDKAFVRSWDDLVAEFGVNANGQIKVAPSWEFDQEYAERYCGRPVVVYDVSDESVDGYPDLYGYSCRDGITGEEIEMVFTSYDLEYAIGSGRVDDDCEVISPMSTLFN